jgi:hypothetical protein
MLLRGGTHLLSYTKKNPKCNLLTLSHTWPESEHLALDTSSKNMTQDRWHTGFCASVSSSIRYRGQDMGGREPSKTATFLPVSQLHLHPNPPYLTPGATITKCHKLGGLQQQKCILSQLWRLEAPIQGAVRHASSKAPGEDLQGLLLDLLSGQWNPTFCIILTQLSSQAFAPLTRTVTLKGPTVLQCDLILAPYIHPTAK